MASPLSGPPRAQGEHPPGAVRERPGLLQNRQRATGQRDPVLPSRFHPLARNAPFPSRKLHLLPQRAAHLPAPERTLAERRVNWRTDGHARVQKLTLERYVFPALGPMPVDAIRGDDVLRVLFQDDPWHREPTTDTASR